MQSDTEAYYGGLNRARDYYRRAIDSVVRADFKEAAALWQANAAMRAIQLWRGKGDSGSDAVSGAGKIGPGFQNHLLRQTN